MVTKTLGRYPIGRYQLQAAIAADWPQILALHDVLDRVAPGPLVTLSRAVALAMVQGPKAGLALLGTLDTDGLVAGSSEQGTWRRHGKCYLRAAGATASLPKQRYPT